MKTGTRHDAALVVFSGGQDSTTCLFWAKEHFAEVRALTFLYGQKHREEVNVAQRIARTADVAWDVLDASFIASIGTSALTPAFSWTARSPQRAHQTRSCPVVISFF